MELYRNSHQVLQNESFPCFLSEDLLFTRTIFKERIEHQTGIEPTTFWVETRRSTYWAIDAYCCPGRDRTSASSVKTRRPAIRPPGILFSPRESKIASLRVVLLGGIKPPTSPLEAGRSIQLSYKSNWASSWNRTNNLLITNELLCLLSYRSLCCEGQTRTDNIQRMRLTLYHWATSQSVSRRNRTFTLLCIRQVLYHLSYRHICAHGRIRTNSARFWRPARS
jgi:hypothetical protein